MTTPSSRDAIDQAELLQDLVTRFLAGRMWTRDQRTDARFLVEMLIQESTPIPTASGEPMNTLERKLRDDTPT